ncbi:CLUMA_CG014748, isoform A [Clunio marinus]|uniref:CLUMA_CG014748, isoform A n=1 Tax=Clunio marinus TaxID=568069 RepID=A0A1J1ISB2_9DIPT|nr:CLUMA_CG014748, isoform A [Clunio marinus]
MLHSGLVSVTESEFVKLLHFYIKALKSYHFVTFVSFTQIRKKPFLMNRTNKCMKLHNQIPDQITMKNVTHIKSGMGVSLNFNHLQVHLGKP